MTLTLFSPAKINFFLRILGKRRDGYHELASLFQTIDLGDTLTFSLAHDEDRLTCSDLTLACDASHLVTRAVDLFRLKTDLRFFVTIHLEKHIPIQAGLGGGSSNAATTLWALNALHDYPVDQQDLQIWSAQIGSDAPFFFSQGTAYCTGRGEKVRNLPPVRFYEEGISLSKPNEGITTPAVYKALQLERCSKIDPEEIIAGFYSGHPTFLNDLEEPAFRLLPILQLYKKELRNKGVINATMTGSGTAFFGFKGELPKREHVMRSPLEWYAKMQENDAIQKFL